MTHRILSAAALASGVAATSGPAPLRIPAAAPSAPGAQTPPAGEEAAVDVVLVSDATAAIANAEVAATAAECKRWSGVLASDAGKAAPQMASWMLQNNPTASTEAIVAQLATMPAGAAPAAQIAPPTPPAPPAAITVPLSETPKVEVSGSNNSGNTTGMTQEEIDKMWDSGIAAATASTTNKFGADLAPGVPRTGN